MMSKVVFPEECSVHYRSAGTVCDEGLIDGQWMGLCWSSGAQARQASRTADLLVPLDKKWVPAAAFALEMDGQSLQDRWCFMGREQREGSRPGTQEVVIRLRHQVRPVDLTVMTRLDDTGVLTRWLEITNTGSLPAALSHVSPWCGVLWNNNLYLDQWNNNLHPDRLDIPFDESRQSPFTIGYYKSKQFGEEGNFVWEPLTRDVFRIERFWGSLYSAPNYIIRNEVTGEMFLAALAWSGNYFVQINYFDASKTLHLDIGPNGMAPLRLIDPGEMIATPEVHLLPTFHDLDQATSEWHSHYRQSIAPVRPSSRRILTIAGRVVQEPGDWIRQEILMAAEMGIEAFVVDAGWYGDRFSEWGDNRGDWYPGPFLPGEGIETLRQTAHDHGMLFGVWLEPEVMGAKSNLIRKHPEWGLKIDGAPSAFINMADPKAAEYVCDSITRVIDDHGLDIMKTDYNNRNRIPGGIQILRDHYAENEEWRHYETLYQIYDQIRKAHPEILLENCAGGGGRLDIGMMSHFDYGCESDWSLFPFSIKAINALTLFLPPESLCYYHNHLQRAHQTAEMETHLRVTLFAIPVYVGFGAEKPDDEDLFYERTRYYIRLHKGFCRPVLEGHPIVYHHSPDAGSFQPGNWCVLEYALPDRSRGYAGVFKTGDSPSESSYMLYLRGVDKTADYRITTENDQSIWICSGRVLAQDGLRIRLGHKGLSELILYEKDQKA